MSCLCMWLRAKYSGFILAEQILQQHADRIEDLVGWINEQSHIDAPGG